jgi:hypothetical protein
MAVVLMAAAMAAPAAANRTEVAVLAAPLAAVVFAAVPTEVDRLAPAQLGAVLAVAVDRVQPAVPAPVAVGILSAGILGVGHLLHPGREALDRPE